MNVPDKRGPSRLGDRAEQMHLEAIGMNDIRIELSQQFAQSRRINDDSEARKEQLSKQTQTTDAIACRPAC